MNKTRTHDDVMKWKHFPRYSPFVREIHRSPVNSHHKGQWCRALMSSLTCDWINNWVNNREGGSLRRHHAHYDVIVMTERVMKSWPYVLDISKIHPTIHWAPIHQYNLHHASMRNVLSADCVICCDSLTYRKKVLNEKSRHDIAYCNLLTSMNQHK